MCHICYKRKTPIEIVSDKLIMYIDGLNSSNSPRQIDHPKYTTLATDNITFSLLLIKNTLTCPEYII